MATVGRPATEPCFAYLFHKGVVYVHIVTLIVGGPSWVAWLVRGDFNVERYWIAIGPFAFVILLLVLIRTGKTLRAAASPKLALPMPRATLRRCYLVYASVSVTYVLFSTGLSSLAWLLVAGVGHMNTSDNLPFSIGLGILHAAVAVVSGMDVYVAKELVPARRLEAGEVGATTAATKEAGSDATAIPEGDMHNVCIADDRQFSNVDSGTQSEEDTSRPPPFAPSSSARAAGAQSP